MSDTVVRNAVREDAGVILGFIRELAEYEKLSAEVTATETGIAASLFGATPRAYALIAECENRAVGFALYFFTYSTFLAKPGLYLEDLFVKEESRGGGIGTALLRRLAEEAMRSGCGRMEWSVLDWNAPSIGFYRSIGAQPVDGWTVQRLDMAGIAALAVPR